MQPVKQPNGLKNDAQYLEEAIFVDSFLPIVLIWKQATLLTFISKSITVYRKTLRRWLMTRLK